MNQILSSSEFYTKFAKTFESYASLRKPYIEAVNRFVINEAGAANTIIDIGSGDGERAVQIAKDLEAQSLALVDNSDGMIARIQKMHDVTIIKADISNRDYQSSGKYDLVLCLWNVLGHIPEDKRETALKNLASLLNEPGILILDVNNRYNASQYGIAAVAKNIVKDVLLPKDSNGDFELCINTDIASRSIKTSVHLFSPFEMDRLFRSAGLLIDKKIVINYNDGSPCKSIFGGQLVYKMTKQ